MEATSLMIRSKNWRGHPISRFGLQVSPRGQIARGLVVHSYPQDAKVGQGALDNKKDFVVAQWVRGL